MIVIRDADPVTVKEVVMNKFRPQDNQKRYMIKLRRLTGRSENYNWCPRSEWYPAGWGPNKKVLGKIFGRLHYLACHAPAPVQAKWRRAYRALEERMFTTRASMRYANKYSADSWL